MSSSLSSVFFAPSLSPALSLGAGSQAAAAAAAQSIFDARLAKRSQRKKQALDEYLYGLITIIRLQVHDDDDDDDDASRGSRMSAKRGNKF